MRHLRLGEWDRQANCAYQRVTLSTADSAPPSPHLLNRVAFAVLGVEIRISHMGDKCPGTNPYVKPAFSCGRTQQQKPARGELGQPRN